MLVSFSNYLFVEYRLLSIVNYNGLLVEFLATSVDHPRLTKTDAETIRTFLRYNQYEKKVKERTHQLVAEVIVANENVLPARLKFCMDPEYLESSLVLGFIEDDANFDDLKETFLRSFLNSKTIEEMSTVTIDSIGTIVESQLYMNLADSSAKSRMQNLFVCYHCI